MYLSTLFDNMDTFHILTEVIFVFTKLNQTCAKIYFHLVKLVLLLFEKFLKNSDDYSNTFYLVTLGEEIDCGRKECETKKNRIIYFSSYDLHILQKHTNILHKYFSNF